MNGFHSVDTLTAMAINRRVAAGSCRRVGDQLGAEKFEREAAAYEAAGTNGIHNQTPGNPVIPTGARRTGYINE